MWYPRESTCSDATLSDFAEFDFTIRASGTQWDVAFAKPTGARSTGHEVQWSDKGCWIELTYEVPLAKPRAASVFLSLWPAHAGIMLHHRRGTEECEARGGNDLDYEPDDGRIPEIPPEQLAMRGDYAFNIVWQPGSCAPDAPPPDKLTYSIGFDDKHRPVVTGLEEPTLTWTDSGFQLTSGPDVGVYRHAIVQDVARSGAAGTVTFRVLDGDLVTCTRTGTLTR